LRLRSLFAATCLFGVVVSAACQGLARTAAADTPGPVRQTLLAAPVNLRVLPRDISRTDLDGLMHQYNEELGVSCTFCHAEGAGTRRLDFASDDNPRKQTARLMIAMLREINDKYLAQLGDPSYPVLVTCGNCHLGQSAPPHFEPKAVAASHR
jgi:hypothetical protein